MMDPRMIEDAQRACLKQCFGGALESQEQELLDRYLATPEGRQYEANSSEMQRLLGDVAEVRVASPVDSGEMVAAFEAMVRDELQASRHRFPLYLLLTTGLALTTGLVCLNGGKPESRFFAWTMIAVAPLCAWLFIELWRRDGALLSDENLLKRLDEEREIGESKPAVIVASVLFLGFLIILGIGVAKAGGKTGVAFMIVFQIMFTCVGVIVAQRRRRKHQELWDWWDGRRV